MSGGIAQNWDLGAISGKPARESRPTLLGALRRWWLVGRHYRPEQRYMRG